MKSRKGIVIAVFGLFLIAFSSCKKCNDENPRARVINNGSVPVSVQIKTSGGNTENINNVDPATSSDFRNYAPGQVTFTIVVDKDEYIKAVAMEECFEYDIVIDAANNVVSIPTDRNE
ncbi:MAG TPA: hypothetical protein VK927_00635 [Adhaeribacter sp.]|nr:hypothetical protein [Adhaeribacter sp.]